MARRIPDELIDEIRAANDVVDVISERIPVKRAGRNYRALCPFHQEKTPSFNINPERQIYHCFGCGVGGNVITFLMEYEKIGFLDALTELAERAGISLPERGAERRGEEGEDPIYRTNDHALRHFRDCFRGGARSAAREYWRDRGLSDQVAETFAIGYAPPGWDGLLKAASRQGIDAAALEEAGLVIRREDGRCYDRFRDRLIFPLLVRGDRAVGFGGRALGSTEPKYLNSPETRVYHKGSYLYGLAQARSSLRLSREVILVEGYMDLVSLHQAGFVDVVASAGTALTPEQSKAIARHADKVFIAYDADSAGIAAATRAAEMLVELGLKVRVASFPEGADPDSYLRDAGPDALGQRLSDSLDFIDFLIASSAASTADERETVARRLINTVVRIQDPLKADLMLEKIADALSIRRSAVERAHAARREELEGRRGRRPGVRAAAPADGPVIEGASSAAQKGLLALLLSGGDTGRRVRDELEPADFADPVVRSIVERVRETSEPGDAVDVAALLDDVEGPEAAALLTELSVLPGDDQDGARACDDYIRTMRRSGIKGEIRTIDRAIETAEMTGSEDELMSLAAERQELARRLRDLNG